MANRFRAAVKTTTITVQRIDVQFDADGQPIGSPVTVTTFEYQTRYQGHGSILRAIAGHDGLDAIIEDAIDGLIKKSKGKAGTAEIVKAVMADIETKDMSIGVIAAKVIKSAPDLVAELLASGAVLQDGETIDDFIDWLESLTLSEIMSIATQWYTFNFEGGIGPFVAGLTSMFSKAPKPAANASKPTANQSGFRAGF